jgi:hypothetical protein
MGKFYGFIVICNVYIALVGDGVNFRDSDGVRIPTLSRRLAA